MKVALNLKNNPFIFTSLIILLVALIFFAALSVFQIVSGNDNAEKSILSLCEGWEYKWSDGMEGEGGNIDFSKVQGGSWNSFSVSKSPLENRSGNGMVWFRVRLPKNESWHTAAVFLEIMLSKRFEAYIDERLIFEDETYVVPFSTNYHLSKSMVVIPIQKESLGKYLYLKVYSDLGAIGPQRDSSIGSFDSINKLSMKKDMGNIILGFFCIVFGFFILPNIIFVSKKDRKSIIYLCIFIISVGCVFIGNSTGKMSIIFSENLGIYAIVYAIAAPTAIVSLIAFFRQVFSFNSNKILNIWWGINTYIYYILGMVTIWILYRGFIPNEIIIFTFYPLLLADIVIQFVIVLRHALKGNIDAKIFTFGVIVYSFVGIIELPLYLIFGIVPSMYKWGVLIFIAALMLILGRRFSDAHEKLVIYSNELEINNKKLNTALVELQNAKAEVDELNRTLENRVEERTSQLKEAMDSLVKAQYHLIQSEKMAALGGLVVGVAHEINTPVGIGVTAASHLEVETKEIAELYRSNRMKRYDLDSYIDMCIQSTTMILTNLKRAAELIRSFKKVATDQSSEVRRRFKIGEYINEVLISLSPEIKKTSHRIEVKCPEDLELDSYPGAFSQIVSNLVMNSLIHAYDEGQSGTLLFNIYTKEDELIFEYSDDGKGIEKEMLSKIFDPFFTTKRNNGGTGLGLNIVYNLVTQTLKGTISCESEPGSGTKFIVTVPAA